MLVTATTVRRRQPLSKVSVSQAARLTGKSRETINKATKSGKLSFSRNASNHKEIDVAELERAYPLVATIDEINQEPAAVSSSQPASDSDASAEMAVLREKLAGSHRAHEMLAAERDRERRQLESEIENLRQSLEKSQEQHNKSLLLITDQSKQTKDRVGEWEESIHALETRIANHEHRAKREQLELRAKAKRRIARLQEELEAERSRTLLQKLKKLFG